MRTQAAEGAFSCMQMIPEDSKARISGVRDPSKILNFPSGSEEKVGMNVIIPGSLAVSAMGGGVLMTLGTSRPVWAHTTQKERYCGCPAAE